eukprot:2108701-Pyramimonas_sp.AAC.1
MGDWVPMRAPPEPISPLCVRVLLEVCPWAQGAPRMSKRGSNGLPEHPSRGPEIPRDSNIRKNIRNKTKQSLAIARTSIPCAFFGFVRGSFAK